MDDVGDGALPDHSIVEPQIGKDLPALSEDRYVQHHPLFHGKFPSLQLPQGLQLSGLQLRHESKAPHVDAKNRNLVQCHQLGQVKNRAVSAKGDQQIRILQLLEQWTDLITGKKPRTLVFKGRTHHCPKAQFPQDLLGGPGDRHALIPVGIGTQDNLLAVHWLFPSPRSRKT